MLNFDTVNETIERTRCNTEAKFNEWWQSGEAALFRDNPEALARMAWMDGYAQSTLERVAELSQENREFLENPHKSELLKS